MSRPGTRRFIGPLTPAQQIKRLIVREKFRTVREIAEARNITMPEAFAVYSLQRRLHWWEMNE